MEHLTALYHGCFVRAHLCRSQKIAQTENDPIEQRLKDETEIHVPERIPIRPDQYRRLPLAGS